MMMKKRNVSSVSFTSSTRHIRNSNYYSVLVNQINSSNYHHNASHHITSIEMSDQENECIILGDSEELLTASASKQTPLTSLRKSSGSHNSNNNLDIDDVLRLFFMCAYSAFGYDVDEEKIDKKRTKVKLNLKNNQKKTKIAPKRRRRTDEDSDGDEDEDEDETSDTDTSNDNNNDAEESSKAHAKHEEKLERVTAWVDEQMDQMRQLAQTNLIDVDALSSVKTKKKKEQDNENENASSAGNNTTTKAANGLWSWKIESLFKSSELEKSVEELTRIVSDGNEINQQVTKTIRQEDFQAWIDAFASWLSEKVDPEDDVSIDGGRKTRGGKKKSGDKNTFQTRAQILMLVMMQADFQDIQKASLQDCIDALVGSVFCICDGEIEKQRKSILKPLLPEPEVLELTSDDE